ncbi:hypothetical protein GCM10010315_47950 [Streptomyces luteosporeus]|uniref:Uncharacterized protein n=1 Tax=Streptomyces luteosporeus TaxID=173856 RepID=A0ABN3U1I0_9ACTN
MRPVAVTRGLDRFGERRILDDGVEQTVQAHEEISVPVVGKVNNASTRHAGHGRGFQRTTSLGAQPADAGAAPHRGAP